MSLSILLRKARCTVAITIAALAAISIAACTSSESSNAAAAAQSAAPKQVDQWAEQARAQAAAHAREKPKPQACELVTAMEMASIVGQTVSASDEDQFTDQTICTYKTADQQTVINFQVDWGNAAAAAMGMGGMGQSGPAAAESSDGLGDGYTQFGPTMMIRVGDDLVTLQIMGVDDVHATARRMLQIARPRM